MFNQTLKNICSFFAPGKKSIFSAENQEMAAKQPGKSMEKSNVRLLYHRDIDDIKTIEARPEPMQHDWWIN